MTMLHVIRTGVVFNAVQAGEHKVHVRRAGNEIRGSPFSVLVSDADIACADGVKVYGHGLFAGQSGQPCQFFIDTSAAGQQPPYLYVLAVCLSCSLLHFSYF